MNDRESRLRRQFPDEAHICKEALYIQAESNLSGVVLLLSDILTAMAMLKIQNRETHPATTLTVGKISDLCARNGPPLTTSVDAVNYCKEKASHAH